MAAYGCRGNDGSTRPAPAFAECGRPVAGIGLPEAYASFEQLLLDLDPATSPDLLLDARELASLEPQQFDAVYCSHNLEHVRGHEVPLVLAGFRHVLKPGGLAQIIVPDLQALMAICVQQGLDLDGVLYEAPVGPVTPLDVLYGHGPTIERTRPGLLRPPHRFQPPHLGGPDRCRRFRADVLPADQPGDQCDRLRRQPRPRPGSPV
jgi:SAM-dependent methyltransferase